MLLVGLDGSVGGSARARDRRPARPVGGAFPGPNDAALPAVRIRKRRPQRGTDYGRVRIERHDAWLVHIDHSDGHGDRVVDTGIGLAGGVLPVVHGDCHGVAGFALVVQGVLDPYLPAGRVQVEATGVRAAQRVGERVAVGVLGGERAAHGDPRQRVLRHAAGRALRGEARLAVGRRWRGG